MDSDQVNKLIDRHIQKHQSWLDETYDVGDENEDIHFHNSIISILKTVQKEVKVFGMVEDSNDPYNVIDLLNEVNVDNNLTDLMIELLDDD